ncbi:peptide-methionine (S)-S-oxide reductase MsrA [Novosphingobium piscinae]|uniref:Peptide methionine sulfoxide reductase MsrA n=1 Tax=Novosphingobium piscinae TaxID=1507448 RepID=A0A7X1FZT7_9SPHN|nr:peptide-methionine (S)-S-oxide reductase MsrA [Novosphingobium piscinae]
MRTARIGLVVAALAGTIALPLPLAAAPLAPAAKVAAPEETGLQTALFAGGCFWGIEAVFSHLRGVHSAVSGYHGGTVRNPSYEDVSDGRTGHAETVRVRYDPRLIRYDQLLRVFFSVGADPTLLNRQGPDVGTQYRSALIPLNETQRRVAQAYLAQLAQSGLWSGPIVTRIEPYRAFYPAEAYHQDFAAANPFHGYIRRWDAPKIEALKRLFPQFYKPAFTRG